tara:strand:+ start:3471 stop:3884 length:414 start_codon:yes stop_codon:yes gene_type:complete
MDWKLFVASLTGLGIGGLFKMFIDRALNGKKNTLENSLLEIDFQQKTAMFRNAELDSLLESYEKLKARQIESENRAKNIEKEFQKVSENAKNCRVVLKEQNEIMSKTEILLNKYKARNEYLTRVLIKNNISFDDFTD